MKTVILKLMMGSTQGYQYEGEFTEEELINIESQSQNATREDERSVTNIFLNSIFS